MTELEISKPNAFTDTNPVTNFFPIEPEPSPERVQTEPTIEEIDGMARAVLKDAIGVPDESEDSNNFIYEAYRKVEDLPPTAKTFYSALSKFCSLIAPTANSFRHMRFSLKKLLTHLRSGAAADISLDTMVHAVYMLEQAIVAWQKAEGNQ